VVYPSGLLEADENAQPFTVIVRCAFGRCPVWSFAGIVANAEVSVPASFPVVDRKPSLLCAEIVDLHRSLIVPAGREISVPRPAERDWIEHLPKLRARKTAD
jgi:hypothetical protein